MPPLPASFEEFQARRNASERRQLSRGFGYFLLTRSAIALLTYAAFWGALLFLRGAAYARAKGTAYWIGVPVLLLFASTASTALQYLQLKRSIRRYASTCRRDAASQA